MPTVILSHPDHRHHDTGAGHPERAARIQAVWQLLDSPEFRDLERIPAPEAAIGQLIRVHDRGYVEAVLAAIPDRGYAFLDPDTVLSPTSRSPVLRAAGAVCAAVDAVMAGRAANAFCAVRPCGHHAGPARAMGFCVFNNIAVGAAQARRVHDVRRIAVVDFDVHHGNGTQAMVEADEDLFFASTHQAPFYPGTGAADECGPFGNVVNVPLPAFSGSEDFREGVERFILPTLDVFAPELVMISAGFDAHRRDPLAQLQLEAGDFAWITRELVALARRHCDGRIVSVLEGGYDLTGLVEGCAAHLNELRCA